MPVEIRELVIKASIADTDRTNSNSASLNQEDLERLKKEIIRSCLQELFQHLEDKKER